MPIFPRSKDKDAAPAPKFGAKRYFFLIGNHFFRLFMLNLLTLLLCLPVVTIPAALTAASRAALLLLRGGSCMFWEEYRAELRVNFFRKLLYWLPMALVPVGLGLWPILLGFGTGTALLVFGAALLLSMLLQCYFFTLVALIDLPVKINLKNAAALIFLDWKTALRLLAVLACTLGLSYGLWPYSLIPAFFLFFSGLILFACQQVSAAADKYGLIKKE
ncbi:MAG: hypothetical protein RR314_05570 [Oscillospiraceae bacterium]